MRIKYIFTRRSCGLGAAKRFPAYYAGSYVQKEHLRHTSKYRILRFTSRFEVADVREQWGDLAREYGRVFALSMRALA